MISDFSIGDFSVTKNPLYQIHIVTEKLLILYLLNEIGKECRIEAAKAPFPSQKRYMMYKFCGNSHKGTLSK